ncbi:peptidoglycan DD-metalloendopeptidase family protein, partial [Candidatus Zixiibacteriota bacterium]
FQIERERMPRRRNWTIVFIPDDESEPRQVRLSRSAMRLLIALVASIVVAVGIGVATYWNVASVALETSRVDEENAVLRDQIEQVWDLERLMADMLETDYKIRTQMGIEFPEDWPGYNYQLGPDVVGEQDGTVLSSSGEGIITGRERDVSEESAILFAWPVVKGFPTVEFGQGEGAAGGPHTGLDIAARTNAPIRAAADGKVTFAGMDDQYGFLCEIDHNNRLTTRYGHCVRLVVREEQLVKKGEIIAYVGSTGRVTTGPHLHFEVQKNGQSVDPRSYLPKI